MMDIQEFDLKGHVGYVIKSKKIIDRYMQLFIKSKSSIVSQEINFLASNYSSMQISSILVNGEDNNKILK
jgi:hypothetical protein